jgi:hypothetical protein
VVLGGETHSLAIERDPVEVLRMGIPFDTCLSLDKGCNAASTVINAADANKRVIYLRDASGRILARKLVAVSRKDELVGYNLYVAAKEKREAVAAAFLALCQELGRDAGLPLAAQGEPQQIHEGFWYDDGTVPFEPEARDADVSAYCRALGVPLPAVVGRALRREAAAHGALVAADPAAITAALADTWEHHGPFRRAAAWLVERLGPDDLVAPARRSSSVAAVAVTRAAERGARPMLDLAGRIADWRTAEQATVELARFPRDAETARALVAAATLSRHRAPRFDDHGLEHRTMYLLPVYAAEIPIAATLALCDEVEPIWAWVVSESEQSCADCARYAQGRLLDALASGYARARDPGSVIRALESPRAGLLARRAALRIAACYALAEDGPLPSLPPPRIQPVRPCPAALRALALLRRRAPELEGEPDLLAALLRQSAGAPPHGVTLSQPRQPPFEALGDLLLQLDLSGVLAPYLEVAGEASAWEPGPWELYFHRRVPTARRAALRSEAMRSAPRSSKASDLLAWLGDVSAIGKIAAVAPSGEGRAGRPRARAGCAAEGHLPMTLAPGIAADVAAQMAVAAELGPGGIRIGSVEAPVRAGNAGGRTVDPGLVAAAFAAVERGLDTRGEGMEDAFTILHLAGVPTPALRCLVERIVAAPALTEEARAVVVAFLRLRTTHDCPEVSPALAVAAGRHEALRPALFGALAKVDADRLELGVTALRAAAIRAGEGAFTAAFFDVFFDGWARALLARGSFEALAGLDDEDLFRRAVRLALASGAQAATAALGIYQETRSHAQAVTFLDELSRSPERATPAMRAAVGALRAWGTGDEEHAARYAWLCAGAKRGPGSPRA